MQRGRARPRRVATITVGALALWAVALVVAGTAASSCQTRKIADRIGRSLDATARFGDGSLALVRGAFTGRDLTIDKDEVLGTLRVRVRSLDADLLPMGLALVDARPRRLELAGVEIEASSLALLRARRAHGTPFTVDALALRDVHLAAVPIAALPGLGRIEVHLDRVEAGPTVLRTPLSWVFSLRELAATVDLPAGVRVHLEYAGGVLHAQGGVLGSRMVEVPLAIPTLDPARELDQLQALGLDLLEKIAVSGARSWLEDQWDTVKGWLP